MKHAPFLLLCGAIYESMSCRFCIVRLQQTFALSAQYTWGLRGQHSTMTPDCRKAILTHQWRRPLLVTVLYCNIRPHHSTHQYMLRLPCPAADTAACTLWLHRYRGYSSIVRPVKPLRIWLESATMPFDSIFSSPFPDRFLLLCQHSMSRGPVGPGIDHCMHVTN